MRRLCLILVLALALILISSASPRRTANAPTLFVRVSGSDAGRCTRAAPCASLARAYALARPRTIVRVGGGRYGAQTIESRPALARPRVIFQPARGARVTVSGELRIRASHLELQRMTLDDLELPREANDVVFRNIRNHGVWMQGPSNIAFFGGEVSCGVCPFHSHLDDGGPPDFRPPRNILFDGVSFHDWQAASAGQHTECLQILAGNGITIRNSVFRNCATANNGRGEVSGFAPPGDIHRVSNLGDHVAISIHLYGTDISRVGSSVRREYDLPVRA